MLAIAVGLLIRAGHSQSMAHETMEFDVSFECRVATITGTLTYVGHPSYQPQPPSEDKSSCVVIVGGTLSNTRDGDMGREGVPQRDALRRLAQQLASAGYFSLRYDKVGYGGSKPKKDWTGSYHDEAEVAAAAIKFARGRKNVSQVVAAGESAGAYVCCLAAADGAHADAYIFLGGHCGPGTAIYEYNFKRLADLAAGDAAWREWAEKNARFELALGRHFNELFAAAKAGKADFELVDGDFRRAVALARRREEIDHPPDRMFRHIKKPALAVSGEFDLNVPPDHAARIVETIRRAGNHNATCVKIAGADHSFQVGATSEDERLRERYNFSSFKREYSPQLYEEIAAWLDRTLPNPSAKSKAGGDKRLTPAPPRAVEQSEREALTESSPARLLLAPGIQIVEDIKDQKATPGVETLEGRIGPLLLGENSQAHFIDMQSGLYCAEHPHSNESIIYTVRGRWVLCSRGRRQVMEPGSLFHFAKGTPTGYEVPFDEDALILIFKSQRLTQSDRDFIAYLKGLASRLKKEEEAGVAYRLVDLPADHPAIEFAQRVNPEYGK
jgi:pimeloyl-ACP methyl ester carboxylesterase/quercetin dioxygenase-like cupin family protein